MTELNWDLPGERLYETGIELCVLYLPDDYGLYSKGVVWNGITGITESTSGAEVTSYYAANRKYLSLQSREEFGGTIESYTYPDEFLPRDGVGRVLPGVAVHLQSRRSFGLSYVTLLGNDTEATEFGFKLHLVYQALASPSERAYTSVSDSPEPISFSWEFTTTPTPVGLKGFKPTSHLIIDSTQVDPGKLEQLQDILYGTSGHDPRLPKPFEVISILYGVTYNLVDDGDPYYSSPGLLDGGDADEQGLGYADEGELSPVAYSDTIDDPIDDFL